MKRIQTVVLKIKSCSASNILHAMHNGHKLYCTGVKGNSDAPIKLVKKGSIFSSVRPRPFIPGTVRK